MGIVLVLYKSKLLLLGRYGIFFYTSSSPPPKKGKTIGVFDVTFTLTLILNPILT